jgi:26S proteasome regulatory subunit N11
LQSFEQLNSRAVAVVVDPIQSVKGKVVIDAFRTINPQSLMLGQEPRQTTSNVGHLNKPSIQVGQANAILLFAFMSSRLSGFNPWT